MAFAIARTKREFATRLGGAWITEGSGPLATWVRHSSQIRHRVVHGGYVPLRTETDEALDAVHGLEQVFYERLVVKNATSTRERHCSRLPSRGSSAGISGVGRSSGSRSKLRPQSPRGGHRSIGGGLLLLPSTSSRSRVAGDGQAAEAARDIDLAPVRR
jgi:hypothetical protein